MTGPRLRLAALGLLALLTAAVVPTTSPALAATDDPALTDSASTRSGSGRFADLDVTVGKTAALGNEAVRVSWQWTGNSAQSHVTTSDTSWNYNYFSVFQCWGDDPSGPEREQCEYGGQFSDRDAGTNRRLSPFTADPKKGWALSRAVSPLDAFGHTIEQSTDPLEYGAANGYPAEGGKPGIVPMRASPTAQFPHGETLTSIDTGSFFDLYGTNEVPLARTNGDGSGQVYFEMQTVYESQFLGCGERLAENSDGSAKARSCWLVVVPRDSIDADGSDVRTRTKNSDRALFSSPLSLSNWKHRITFPLDFEPVRKPCALGGVERPIVGHESLSVAISSWQTPLCAAGQGFFYASTTDDIARQTARSLLPKFSVVTEPLPADALGDRPGSLVYAPLAVSGVSVSFFIERYYATNVADKYRVNNGTRVEELRLTPRLVAKLLTQSYRYSTVTIGGGPDHLTQAPLSLIDDPEFLAVNDFVTDSGAPDVPRDLAHLSNQRDSLAKIFVSPDESDAIRLVWEWILGDTEARRFLAGQPDDYGMTINPYFKGIENYEELGVPRADIPRLDGVCIEAAVGFGNGETRPVCPLDAAPYVASFDSGAALTGRGQPTGSQSWVKEPGSGFVKPEKASPQLVGQRALITLTDTPSSQRRGLVAASLRNADGTFVAPTTSTMTTALSQAVDTTTPAVMRVASEKVKDGGYPLTRISYGVTNPALLDQSARNDYADFTAFVGTDGQLVGSRPGQLPIGYAPLPRSMRARTLVASDRIRTATSPPATSPPATMPTASKAASRPVTPAPPATTTKTPVPASAASTAAPDGDPSERGGTTGPATGGLGGVAGLPGVGSVPVTAHSTPATAKPSVTPEPATIQRVSALTPATELGPLRWMLPGLALLGVGAAAANRLIVRRGARDAG